MAFPLTHLLVADLLLKGQLKDYGFDHGLFLLGSIAPDAVHYRKGFTDAKMSGIGDLKKHTHLIPAHNPEKWGQIKDTKGWEQSIVEFIGANLRDSFMVGYAVHTLTDIFNTEGIWHRFTTNNPQEAAKGYDSEYYKDLRKIDTQLYHRVYVTSGIETKLSGVTPQGAPERVTADEVAAIRQSLLDQYVGTQDIDSSDYSYVTYDEVLQFVQDAAGYCARVILANIKSPV